MVVSDAIHNIMGGIENTGDVRLHNHRRKLKQRFDIVKKLGQGTYGKVQLGINKETGQEVAIKMIRKSKIETEADLIRIRREIQIMSSVKHPNIIHIYEVFENREKMVLVMEYAAGGELYDYLSDRKVLSEDEARRIFRQIASAIYYCHKHNICHRDLKLENILLDEVGNAKIADFGLSNVFSYNSLLSTFCGSPLYASPEIVKGTPYLGPEVDCWSLGVLLYTLVYGAMPFDGSNFKRLVKQISQGNYFEPKNPSPASSLIAEMLNVNPARRADIVAICNHKWVNETYSETCLDVAEELATQAPVRLDLLLSLMAPPVVSQDALIHADEIVPNSETNNSSRPVRSQSLGSIPPVTVPVPPQIPPILPVPETRELEPEEKKPRKKKERDGSHSRTRRKDRSCSKTRKTHNQESHKKELKSVEDNQRKLPPLINSGTQVICKDPNEESSNDDTSVPIVPHQIEQNPIKKTEPSTVEVQPKVTERRRSKVFEVAEKFNNNAIGKSTSKVSLPKKVILPGISVDSTRREIERKASLTAIPSTPSKKNSISEASPVEDEAFPLASTIALNKLVESVLKDEQPNFKGEPESFGDSDKFESEKEEQGLPKVVNAIVQENVKNKAATLPRRRTTRAEIKLVPPQYSNDSYRTEVEHFINKPTTNHKTEIIFPIAPSSFPKVLNKTDNQSKEHVIPIHIEQEPQRKVQNGTSLSSSRTASKSSVPRTSSSSLSRQSTVDSDSGSAISSGEPIRKSPREVIIPIAVEGGGYVTPSENTLNRMSRSSTNDNGDESMRSNSRCFTLRSTKRRHPERNHSTQLDTADSLSSDEDDNYQLLTPENLFSTLLSRVQNLTRRWNQDQMRRSSNLHSLFPHHRSLFDDLSRNRITETRSFSRPESAPWRRNTSGDQPQRDSSIRKRYSYIFEEKPPSAFSCTLPRATSVTKQQFPETNKSNKETDCEYENHTSSINRKTPSTSFTNIEDEFDKFFSKYKTPNESNSFNFPRHASPATNRHSPLTKTHSNDSDAQNDQPKEGIAVRRPLRKSRFLRPDFYDTPREESKYVIHNENVRAFRERSLSRHRDLSRDRSVKDGFTNGWTPDYARSKTCTMADRLENLQRRELQRTISDDPAANSTSDQRMETEFGNHDRSKRKSLILQNELENEIRKTQNINSKLSGLMDTLNDTENQYERKLRKLYGIKFDENKNGWESENNRENEGNRLQPEFELDSDHTVDKKTGDIKEATEDDTDSKKNTTSVKTENDYDYRSLLDKKYAYFRKLQDPKMNKNQECGKEKDGVMKESNICLENEMNHLPYTTATEDLDSDACSMISDNTDSQNLENLTDRIRRRSFYSRFNNYRSRPISYSRSLSADVNTSKPNSSSRSS